MIATCVRIEPSRWNRGACCQRTMRPDMLADRIVSTHGKKFKRRLIRARTIVRQRSAG
jgi:hypothetical protein